MAISNGNSLVLIDCLQRVCMESVLFGHPDRSCSNVEQLARAEQGCGQLSRPVFPAKQLAVAADCRILYERLALSYSEVAEKTNADRLDSNDCRSRGRCALSGAECACNGKQCRSATVFPLVMASGLMLAVFTAWLYSDTLAETRQLVRAVCAACNAVLSLVMAVSSRGSALCNVLAFRHPDQKATCSGRTRIPSII